MRIKFVFVPQALKNLKQTLEIIFKLLSTEQVLPKVYLLYFMKPKNIRFLIDSQKNPIIISLGNQMLNGEQSCSLKENKEMVSIEFLNTKAFFENFINILDKDDQYGLVLDVKKQILDKKQTKFIKLSLKNNLNFLSRLAIDTPKYDISELKYHFWVCGCAQNDKQSEFVIYTEELMNIMRYLIKLKQTADKKLLINFNFQTKTYTARSSDEHCPPNVQGQIKVVNHDPKINEMKFEISVNHLKVVNEILRKFKQIKVIISTSNHLIFVFMKEDLFVNHIDMHKWIRVIEINREGHQGNFATKIQEQEQSSGMRWN